MHMNRFKIMLKCRCPFSMSGLRLEALYFLQALCCHAFNSCTLSKKEFKGAKDDHTNAEETTYVGT